MDEILFKEDVMVRNLYYKRRILHLHNHLGTLATSITDIFASSLLKTKALLLGNIKIINKKKRKG